MRHLVCCAFGVVAFEALALLLGLGEHQRHLVRDEADVLHRSESQRDRDRHRVKLFERIGLAEIILEQLEQLRRRFLRVRGFARATPGYQIAQGRALLTRASAIDDIEGTDRERDQIARQWRRRCEAHALHRHRRRRGLLDGLQGGLCHERAFARRGFIALHRRGHRLLAHDSRVRCRDIAGRHDQGQMPGRLPAGLVEARKHAPRVGRFELRERVPGVTVLLLEETHRLGAIDDAVVVERDDRAAGRHGRRESKPDELGSARDRFRGIALAIRDQTRTANLEPLGVEPEELGRLRELDMNHEMTREALVHRHDRELGFISERLDRIAQLHRRRRGRRERGLHVLARRRRERHRDDEGHQCDGDTRCHALRQPQAAARCREEEGSVKHGAQSYSPRFLPSPSRAAQSACLRKNAGISSRSMPLSSSADTRAAACSRVLRHTAGGSYSR